MTAEEARAEAAMQRGTALQRARATFLRALVAVLGLLPTGVIGAVCDASGELWYRAAPGRAAVARGNLAHVATRLAAERRGSALARAAATDPDALERLVRGAFRQAVRTYAETLRWAATAREVVGNLVLETPTAVEAALAHGGPAVFATLHFGTMSGVGAVLVAHATVPITVPMETLRDPELQRLILDAREGIGVRIIGLESARRELRAALARGELVGVVGDRDIAGGGVPVELFGLPAALPIGPAYLALEADAPLHVAVVRRSRDAYVGHLVTLNHPAPDLPRRARVEALLAAEAAAFEELIAPAPEQWTAVFYPLWEAVPPRARPARGRPSAAPTAP
jgi:KDO2-lipid IV(A) lauroyltransferase